MCQVLYTILETTTPVQVGGRTLLTLLPFDLPNAFAGVWCCDKRRTGKSLIQFFISQIAEDSGVGMDLRSKTTRALLDSTSVLWRERVRLHRRHDACLQS